MSQYSGAEYVGDMRDGWYHGKGEYTYPNGVKYKGMFHKGQFHGEGILIYQNGGQYKGIWDQGKKVSGDYFFFDDLKYEDQGWDYCIGEDRRFNYERNHGIKPAGQTQITNDPKGEQSIPPGTYDTGDGYFDPIRTLVYSYDGKQLLRTPKASEVDWITRTCRYEPRQTATPLTGDDDEIISRIMELQSQGRREMGEELMKGGIRDPAKYFVKHGVTQPVEKSRNSSKLDVGQAKSVANPPSKSNKSQTAEEKAQEVFEGEENGETKKIDRVKSGGDIFKSGDQGDQNEKSGELSQSEDGSQILHKPRIAEEESLDSEGSDD